jgi:RNA polymerase sigma factor (TIGR02999 family)
MTAAEVIIREDVKPASEGGHVLRDPRGDVTRLLAEIRGLTHEEAVDRLIPLVYAELRTMAEAHLRHERTDHTLQATALVHETYLRLLGGGYPNWTDRRHFFHAAGEAMRRLLIEHARKRSRVKRGGHRIQVSLSGVDLEIEQDPEEVLSLDDAIRRLRDVDASAADVVRLRFFAGLSVAETAQTLEVSATTVKREWAFARAWLFNALSGSVARSSETDT